MENYYDILRVDTNASANDIRRNYKKMMLMLNHQKTQTPDTEFKIKQLIDAYKVLSDPYSRGRYDANLEKDKKHNIMKFGAYSIFPSSQKIFNKFSHPNINSKSYTMSSSYSNINGKNSSNIKILANENGKVDKYERKIVNGNLIHEYGNKNLFPNKYRNDRIKKIK